MRTPDFLLANKFEDFIQKACLWLVVGPMVMLFLASCRSRLDLEIKEGSALDSPSPPVYAEVIQDHDPALATGATENSIALDKICKEVKFRDAKGKELTGQAHCSPVELCIEGPGNGCKVTGHLKSVPKKDLVPSVIKSGVVLGGVNGGYTPPSPPGCTADGQTACVASSIYPAALASGLASKVTAGYLVAGISGSVVLPNVNQVYSGVTYGPASSLLTGVLTLPSAANVRATQGPYGIGGNSQNPSLLDCAANEVSGCVTTSTFRSTDWSQLNANNIKNGVTVAGILGNYPSASNLLTGADSTADLDTATFEAKIKSAASFEWFGPDGTRYSANGDGDLVAANVVSGVTIFGTTGSAYVFSQCNSSVEATCLADTACRWSAGTCEVNPWNIRAGVTVASKAGALKMNCRNTITSGSYNWDGAIGSLINTGSTTGTANNFWDTIDDYLGFPLTNVTGWSANHVCDGSNWTDVTTTNGGTSFTTCGTSNTCIYRDELSGLRVTGILGSTNNSTDTASPQSYQWNAAINACHGSTYGGYTAGTWRLPTQKELMALHYHGMAAIFSSNFHTQTNYQSFYWSASTFSNATANAWNLRIANGGLTNSPKTTGLPALCVF